jgi:hypothetical protein
MCKCTLYPKFLHNSNALPSYTLYACACALSGRLYSATWPVCTNRILTGVGAWQLVYVWFGCHGVPYDWLLYVVLIAAWCTAGQRMKCFCLLLIIRDQVFRDVEFIYTPSSKSQITKFMALLKIGFYSNTGSYPMQIKIYCNSVYCTYWRKFNNF